MKPYTWCPNSRRFGIKAPATSASPPVLAYGKISELKTHSFNADIILSLAKAPAPPREKVQALAECGRLTVAGWLRRVVVWGHFPRHPVWGLGRGLRRTHRTHEPACCEGRWRAACTSQ